MPDSDNKNNKNKNDDLYVCENCIHKLNPSSSNKNIPNSMNGNNTNDNKNLRSYEYYQANDDDKYDPINTKEFFEMNRNRYLSELWKKENEDLPHGKKGVKSKSIERKPITDLDKDNNYRELYENGNNNEDKNVEPRTIKRCRNKSTETMHKPIDNKENKNLNNNLKKTNLNDIQDIECPKCGNTYIVSPERRFYYCNDCNNLMCGKCSKKHYLENPEHNCSKADLDKPETQDFINTLSYNKNKDKDNNIKNIPNNPNIINNQINNINTSGQPKKRKLNVKKYINKNTNEPSIIQKNLGKSYDNNEYPNNNTNYNKYPDNELYQDNQLYNNNLNSKELLRNRPNNKLLNSNNQNINNNLNNDNMRKNSGINGILDEDNCFICGGKQIELPDEKFFICKECNHLLCNGCRGRHDDVYPEHNLVTSYISGEINNVNNENKINLNKGIKPLQYDYYNEYINPTNNRYNIENPENLDDNKINKGVNQDKNIIHYNYDKDKTPNTTYQRDYQYYNIKPKTIINKNYSENNNINPTEPDNQNYYNYEQNNNQNKLLNNNIDNNNTQNKYYINKNNINDVNDNNNIDRSNYYNLNQNQNEPSINYDKNLLPNKKINIKRYANKNNRYNNPENDNNYYDKGESNDDNDKENINKSKALRNKNQDLFKKEKCKIEFDLNKDDSQFASSKIFGNPACYNCLKSCKDEKNIQIFYCSQCMKLFCRDCLYLHNLSS